MAYKDPLYPNTVLGEVFPKAPITANPPYKPTPAPAKPNVIQPPAGAIKIRDTDELKRLTDNGLTANDIWKQPGTTNIYRLNHYGLTMGQANDPSNWKDGKLSPPTSVAQNAPTPPSGLTPTSSSLLIGTPPANTPSPTPTETKSPAGSQSAFGMAFGQLMAMGQKNQGLQDQKNKLIQQLYDRPLTPEELRTLSPAQQNAIANGDKALLEFQILTINDMIKGRADENTSALNYMMDGYKLDQEELEKKRSQAFTSFTNIIEKYPQIAAELSPEGFAALQAGEMPPAADVQKAYVAYRTALGNDAAAKKQTPDIEKYEYYKQQTLDAGEFPMSLFDYERAMKNTGSSDSEKPIIQEFKGEKLQWNSSNGKWEQPSGVASGDATGEAASYALKGKIGLIDGLLNSGQGLKSAVGPVGFDVLGAYGFDDRMTPIGAKDDVQEFIAGVNQLVHKDTLDALIALKKQGGTLGALSDQEAQILREAAGKIGSWMIIDEKTKKTTGFAVSEELFKAELQRIKGITQHALDTLGDTAGAAGSPTTYSAPDGTQYEQGADGLFYPKADAGSGANARKTSLNLTSPELNGTQGGQCGRFVNQATGLAVGDSFESKMDKMKFANPNEVRPGDVFCQDIGGPHGHIGFVNSVVTENGKKYFVMTESNYYLKSKPEQVTTTRKILANDPSLKGFRHTA